MSLQGGAEINLTDNLLVSAGYVYANQGVNSMYQSDLTYGLATHTIGAGGALLNNRQYQDQPWRRLYKVHG